jgi:hypothetical protein
MAFRLLPDGTIETDSVEELAQVRERLELGRRPSRAISDDEGWIAFWNGLGPLQQRALTTLRDRSQATVEELRQALGLHSGNAVGGVLRKIAIVAGRSGVPMNSLYRREVAGTGPDRLVTYFAEPFLEENLRT